MALSSYYEADGDPIGVDDDVESSTPQPPQAPTSLFPSSSDQSKSDAKAKSKSKYNVGGARIMTLNNMSSDDEDEKDDESGQVSSFCTDFDHAFNLIAMNWILSLSFRSIRHFMRAVQTHLANKCWVHREKVKILCRTLSNRPEKVVPKWLNTHIQAGPAAAEGNFIAISNHIQLK